MKPLTFGQAIALAEQFERRADELKPCESNLARHAELMRNAMVLRQFAAQIAREQYREEGKWEVI